MTLKRIATLALVACLPLGLAACGGDDENDKPDAANDDSSETTANNPGTGTDSPPDAGVVVIEGFAFSIPASIPAGSVAIQNNDPAPHTLTDDAGSFDVQVEGNASTVAEIPAGTYQVHCEIHSTMTGTLTVA